jgi:ribose transport system substrate-binding protein
MKYARTRGLATLCALAALAVAGGCGDDDDDGAAAGDGGASKTKSYELAFINSNTSDPYFISMACGVQAEAERLGSTVQVQGPGSSSPDPTKQLAILNAVIARNPDAILFDAADAKAFTAPLKQAVRDGIKVLFVNQAPADRSMGSGWVATDDRYGGQLAGEEMIRLTEGKGPVMSLGFNTFKALKDRQEGFTETIEAQAPEMEYVGNFFDPAGAVDKDVGLVSAQLTRHDDMAGVYGLYGAPAERAILAIRNAGKTGEVKVVSFDATPRLVKALKAGALDAAVVQKPEEIGRTATKQVIDVLNGGSAPNMTAIKPVLLTEENFEENEQFLYKDRC